MEQSARDHYLATEIMTATPQRLQLMLIDAALRWTGQAQQHWSEGNNADAGEALVRAQEILGEMIAALDRESQPELVRRVGAVYLFIVRALSDAAGSRDPARLDDAVKVLQEERETWRQVCERFGTRKQLDTVAAPLSAPHVPPATVDATADEPGAGFSLEA